ncbi:MAG: NADH-dependent [FeFe] hydrogenase, group A6 [Alkaliphilus sp.]
MEKVTLTIDNNEVEVAKGTTVLEAAKLIGVDIPSLCYLKDINEVGACRVCLVEVEGARTLQSSCVYPVFEGMAVKTNTKRLRDARKATVELILSDHNRECLMCTRNKNCELQSLAEELNIKEIEFDTVKELKSIDAKSHSIIRDPNKCILCGRCVNMCKNVQEIGILEFTNRGYETEVAPAFNKNMADTPCIYCGQCIVSCPVAALREKEDIGRVWEAIEDSDLHVVVQTAPAVRAALGEEFAMPIGSRVTGKMVTALKRIGFDKVFDTNFGADLTIMEEGHELLNRIENGGKLPQITSCSPGWVNYCEFNYPEFLDNLSTCKSPQQMFGAIVKSYYAEKEKIDPKKIFVVSVMPCTSKKSEAARDELSVAGLQDVDASITTRELGKMIREAGIKFAQLPDSEFDPALGEATGAGAIFGVTGGVMEAALRTVADILNGEPLDEIEYTLVRGVEGIKEAEVPVGDKTIKVAIAHGIGNAKELLEMIKTGEREYHFIEIMGCSGGCVTGGGQPHVTAKNKMDCDIRVERAKALYVEDTKMKYRKSHENPLIKKLYADYLGKPNGHKAHGLLHTHYTAREKYPV